MREWAKQNSKEKQSTNSFSLVFKHTRFQWFICYGWTKIVFCYDCIYHVAEPKPEPTKFMKYHALNITRMGLRPFLLAVSQILLLFFSLFMGWSVEDVSWGASMDLVRWWGPPSESQSFWVIHKWLMRIILKWYGITTKKNILMHEIWTSYHVNHDRERESWTAFSNMTIVRIPCMLINQNCFYINFHPGYGLQFVNVYTMAPNPDTATVWIGKDRIID